MANTQAGRPRTTPFRVLRGFRPRTSVQADRVAFSQWPAYSSLQESDKLLTKPFEKAAQELVAVAKGLDLLWNQRRNAIAILRNKPRDLNLAGMQALNSATAVAIATQRSRSRQKRLLYALENWQGDLVSQLGLDRKKVFAYLKALRRQILHESREAFRREEELQALLSTTDPLLDDCKLYACGCGSFQPSASGGCEACGKQFRTPPSAAVKGAAVFSQIIELGVYLELGVSHVLDEKGFNVQTGTHVRGLSGVDHQVDVLARSRDGELSVLVEVTRSAANLDELADLVLRKDDIPANGHALVSAGSLSKSCAQYAKAHRIAVFPSIQIRPRSLVEWLEALQREHATAVRS